MCNQSFPCWFQNPQSDPKEDWSVSVNIAITLIDRVLSLIAWFRQ